MAKESITLRDVYDIVNRLESKMDLQFDKHEQRLNVIENSQSKTLGIISVISLFISGALTFFWDRVLGGK